MEAKDFSGSDNSFADCFESDFDYHIFINIHLTLAVCYGILCLLCISHFFYKLYTSSSPQTTWHSLFYPLLFVGSAVRGILMISEYLPTPVQPTNYLTMLIFTFTPSFFFFSAYLIILFRWAQIYHSSYELSTIKYDHLRIMFYLINGLMYALLVTLFLLDAKFESKLNTDTCSQPDDPIAFAIMGLCSALYVLTPLGFAAYTLRITRKFRYLPTKSPAKVSVSRTLQRFTILVLIVFGIRAVWSSYADINHAVNLSFKYPWMDGIYYFFLEIVPLGLMFAILRMHNTNPKANHDSHSSGGPNVTTPLINHTLAFA